MLLAQDLDSIEAGGLPDFRFGISGTQQPARIIEFALPYVFGAAALLLLVYLVTAGLSMMLSRGDPKAMQAAQAKITNALIGFVIVFFAFAIVSIIGSVFGITVFGNIFVK
jgi:uncharacterized membrane protein